MVFPDEARPAHVFAAGLAILIVGLIGLLMYKVLLVRMRGLELSEVITSFSVGIVILELLRSLGIMGFEYRTLVFIDDSVVNFGVGLVVEDYHGGGSGLLVALHMFVHHTRIGLAFRGVTQEEHT